MSRPYAASLFTPARRPTREVRVGEVGIGGGNPIRVQSMTTAETKDTEATASEIERLARAGCEIVRVTAPSIRDAEKLGPIRAALARRGVSVPLVADIHFTPNAALEAAEHVEKVRINPGNYADRKRFRVFEYSEADYAAELERVAERFRPLVKKLKERGRALRIGTNHGSLSDRIMNRYGDTPQGMVASALEFLDVCEEEHFFDVVFSMKASNAQVAIHAYRLLAAELEARAPGRPSYPFHVGVTEAGDGEDGRIKSAIGIGALLEDGLGDTIRVSLTEDPVRELPVARALAERYDARRAAGAERAAPEAPGLPCGLFAEDAYAYARRATRRVRAGALELGGEAPVRVEAALGPAPPDPRAAAEATAAAAGELGDLACEGVALDAGDAEAVRRAAAFGDALAKAGRPLPLALRVPLALAPEAAGAADRVVAVIEAGPEPAALRAAARAAREAGAALEWAFAAEGAALLPAVDAALEAARAEGASDRLLCSAASEATPVHAVRALAAHLHARGAGDLPLVLRHGADPFAPADAALVRAASELGAPLCDGLGDGVALGGFGGLRRDVEIAYRVLQGARLRTSWTEFISCPSCGRTQFDLEETTARVRERTAHLPGVKIAVMGCIVNGPGEMADADFGYVGSGAGKVDLYVGRERVVRNVPEAEAPERLVDLIRERGAWVDPPSD